MEEQRAPSISKIALKWGVILAVVSFVVFVIVAMAAVRNNWITLVNVVLLVAAMVLAHGEYKKTHEGMMTYPQGLGSGTLLSVISSVVGGILTFIYVKYVNTGYIAATLAAQEATLKAQGRSAEQIQQAMAFTGSMMTPVGIVVISIVTGVIGGFIVALIVSIFTRKGDPRAVI